MTNRTIGLAMLALGVGLLCFVFYLGVMAFTNPSTLAGFADLMPESGLYQTVAYLIAIGLLWVMGSIAGRILSYGLAMARSEREG